MVASKTPSHCINCGCLPEIIETGEEELKFTLRHKEPSLCYPTFKLETFQKTKKDCIQSWNLFNKRETK